MRALLLLVGAAAAAAADVFVSPDGDDDGALRGTADAPLRSVHAARDAVRALKQQGAADVTVQLLPGVHHVGDKPLALGPEDSGVTWRSADPSNPASFVSPP